jgi:hypothetical protein
LRRWLAALLVAGCGHPDPFSGGAPATLGPFSGAVPRQLTFNFGTDLTPSWNAAESMLLYSYEALDIASTERLFRRPALAPSGQRLAVEAYGAQVVPVFDRSGSLIRVDTLLSRSADLWLLEGS